jgi:acetylornithine deacetylase
MRFLPLDNPDAFFSELRHYADSLVPAMQAVEPGTFIEFETLSSMTGFDGNGGNAIVDIVRDCVPSPVLHKVSFGSEAALFHAASIPAVICGPGHIEQAHQPNEWVRLEQLARCEAFMERLARHLCGE